MLKRCMYIPFFCIHVELMVFFLVDLCVVVVFGGFMLFLLSFVCLLVSFCFVPSFDVFLFPFDFVLMVVLVVCSRCKHFLEGVSCACYYNIIIEHTLSAPFWNPKNRKTSKEPGNQQTAWGKLYRSTCVRLSISWWPICSLFAAGCHSILAARPLKSRFIFGLLDFFCGC